MVTSFQESHIQRGGCLQTQRAKPLLKTQSASILASAIFPSILSQQARRLPCVPLLFHLLKISQLSPSPNSGQFCLTEVEVSVCLDYLDGRWRGWFGCTSGSLEGSRGCLWSLWNDWNRNLQLKKVEQMKRRWWTGQRMYGRCPSSQVK